VTEIAMIFDILNDGRWHEIEELRQRLNLNEQNIQKITTFLSRYDLVKIDNENRKVKINHSFQKLLAQTVT